MGRHAASEVLMQSDPVADAIDAAYEAEDRGKVRTYIGASIIGNPCDAYLALSLRGFPEDPVSPRLKRIFRDGHRIEAQVVADLKKAGLSVWEVDGLTGRQFEYVAHGGHISSHADGQVEDIGGQHRLLEVKSMNAASFDKLVKDGIRVSHPRYYGQCQMLMGLSGIPSVLFVAYNKNTSEYHSCVVEFDEFEYAALVSRAETAIRNEARRLAKDQTDWRCRGCFKKSACWGHVPVDMKCTTCTHAMADESGRWWCTLKDEWADAPCADWQRYEPAERR